MEMRKKCLCLGLTLLLALASAASAQVAALGPDNPGNGFPKYVKDVNGVKLELPVKPIGDGITAPTMAFDPPIDGNAWSEATGFGSEAFFFLAQSTMNVGGGGRAVLDLGIEAAYGAEEPLNDPPDQFLFGRVRIRIDAPVEGDYIVTHPWGTQTLNITDTATRFTYVYDWGGFAASPNTNPPIPSSFERLLISPTPWRFLWCDTLVGGIVDPPQWVGDGSVGKVTGGFNGVNFFRVQGPPGSNLGGTGNDVVQTDQFTVFGHIYQGPDEPRPNNAARGAVVIPLF